MEIKLEFGKLKETITMATETQMEDLCLKLLAKGEKRSIAEILSHLSNITIMNLHIEVMETLVANRSNYR